ncbi:sensor histidine kinase [Priestia taiwanensis]|uniref:histidine kinase n=2 Tax=Priestia taiwanensis TaxID=1347902 RepID=A0A917ALN7_9BACI|nr:sensor histidine kinase [Priestia taiwanensis]
MRNGEAVFAFLLAYIREEVSLSSIEEMAYKIAKERANADSNIGNFVYNANIGRTALFKRLYDFNMTIVDLQPVINKINMCFDQFIYFVVGQYSEMMSKNLEEKNKFIDETHKERLTILGQMSASFVHEFRNPLTSVMGFIKLLKADHPDTPYLDIISHELQQLNFRISQFLLVSKKDLSIEKEEFDLNELIHTIIEFLYPTLLNTNVIISYDFPKQITVNGTRSELRQVILNILLNSIDALEVNKYNKRIYIDMNETDKEVGITIKNNGPVIPRDKIETIFEPFVTTKTYGTGIGLFVCKQIVQKHNGHITCTSSDDCTSFTITLRK